MEAGGHIRLTTMTLSVRVVAVIIPVIAAGIADGSGAAAGFMLGAAVQVGTRSVVAKEFNAHQNYKDKDFESSWYR